MRDIDQPEDAEEELPKVTDEPCSESEADLNMRRPSANPSKKPAASDSGSPRTAKRPAGAMEEDQADDEGNHVLRRPAAQGSNAVMLRPAAAKVAAKKLAAKATAAPKPKACSGNAEPFRRLATHTNTRPLHTYFRMCKSACHTLG